MALSTFVTRARRLLWIVPLTVVLTSAVGVALLLWSASLPQEPLRQHIQAGVEKGFFAENHPQYLLFRFVDMYTECVGINIALELRPQLANVLSGLNAQECKGLTARFTENREPHTGSYARYWHGSQVLLKPFYTWFSVDQVRWLSVALGLAFMAALFAVATLRLGMPWAAALVLSYVLPGTLTAFPLVTQGIQFWWVLLSCIAVCLWRSPTLPLGLFAIIGAGSTFVSFFSMESLSLSMALLCFCLLRRAEGQGTITTLVDALWLCVAWGAAFLSMWLVKWGLVWLVLPSSAGLLGNTVENYAPRSLHIIAQAITSNILRMPWTVALGILLLLAWRFRRQGLRWASGLGTLWLPAVLPFFWYCLMPGHAERHSFFMPIILWPTMAVLVIVLLGDKGLPTGKSVEKEIPTGAA